MWDKEGREGEVEEGRETEWEREGEGVGVEEREK